MELLAGLHDVGDFRFYSPCGEIWQTKADPHRCRQPGEICVEAVCTVAAPQERKFNRPIMKPAEPPLRPIVTSAPSLPHPISFSSFSSTWQQGSCHMHWVSSTVLTMWMNQEKSIFNRNPSSLNDKLMTSSTKERELTTFLEFLNSTLYLAQPFFLYTGFCSW